MSVDPNDLAAALDNHQVTDGEGKIGEQTPVEDTATPEEAPEKDEATAEKSADEETSPKEEPKSENEPEMVELASDETGKRYVPESRFKEVYAKMKDYERKAKAQPVERPVAFQPVAQVSIPKTDALEIEFLRSTLPQFNPESNEYSREIDELGFNIYEGSKDARGNYAVTRLEAGRKALQMVKKITSKVAEMKTEARTVKAQQSDQGITNRVLNREGTKADPEKMSLEEKEAWLKANDYW